MSQQLLPAWFSNFTTSLYGIGRETSTVTDEGSNSKSSSSSSSSSSRSNDEMGLLRRTRLAHLYRFARRRISRKSCFALAVVAAIVGALVLRLSWSLVKGRRKEQPVSNHKESVGWPRGPSVVDPCSWDFVRYESSDLEIRWINNIERWQKYDHVMCDILLQDLNFMYDWMGGAKAATKSGCGGSEPSLEENPKSEVFSRMRYRNSCNGNELVTRIEPIAGLTRHPLMKCMPQSRPSVMADRAFVVVGLHRNDCVQEDRKLLPDTIGNGKGRLLVFDMGATIRGTKRVKKDKSDFAFITAIYEVHGHRAHAYFGWDLLASDSDIGRVTGGRRPGVWTNVAKSPGEEASANPWLFIRKVARPQDYVVVKLKLDDMEVENEIMQELLGTASLQKLVDEMFYSHRSNTPLMWEDWYTENLPVKLNDTYRIMHTLRKAGIRFHSWP